jgi:ABC-type proline/glycine betaine transport system ATPase subunit
VISTRREYCQLLLQHIKELIEFFDIPQTETNILHDLNIIDERIKNELIEKPSDEYIKSIIQYSAEHNCIVKREKIKERLDKTLDKHIQRDNLRLKKIEHEKARADLLKLKIEIAKQKLTKFQRLNKTDQALEPDSQGSKNLLGEKTDKTAAINDI